MKRLSPHQGTVSDSFENYSFPSFSTAFAQGFAAAVRPQVFSSDRFAPELFNAHPLSERHSPSSRKYKNASGPATGYGPALSRRRHPLRYGGGSVWSFYQNVK
jgi:hypothetical protein